VTARAAATMSFTARAPKERDTVLAT
jgi:hypothetical protein